MKCPGGKSKKEKDGRIYEGNEDEGKAFMRRGRKKYIHQRKAGGFRSPRESGAGSGEVQRDLYVISTVGS